MSLIHNPGTTPKWCEDVNRVQTAVDYDFVYVDEASFDEYHPSSFEQLMAGFSEYKR